MAIKKKMKEILICAFCNKEYESGRECSRHWDNCLKRLELNIKMSEECVGKEKPETFLQSLFDSTIKRNKKGLRQDIINLRKVNNDT